MDGWRDPEFDSGKFIRGGQPFERHPLNVKGPWCVAARECILCGAPEFVAPKLIETSGEEGDNMGCYFKKQPETDEELATAVEACHASCVGAVHYHGNDEDIVKRLGWTAPGECCSWPDAAQRIDLVAD